MGNTKLEKTNSLFNKIRAEKNAFEKISKTFSKNLALNFNSLEFFKIDERKITEILAYFLNPKSEHDQLDIYLRLFCERFNINIDGLRLDNAIVNIDEKTTFGRLIDIYIEIDDKLVIGIENKTEYGTIDQPNQLSDYIDELKNRKPNNYFMFYLSPKDKELSESSIRTKRKIELMKEGKLKIINYENNIFSLIEEYAEKTKNIRVQSFLYDFQIALKKKYLGTQKITTQEMIKDILKDRDNLILALEIESALQDLKTEINERIRTQFYNLVNKYQLKADEGGYIFLDKFKGVFIKYENKDGCFYFGIIKEKNYISNKNLEKKLDRIIKEKSDYSKEGKWIIYKTIYGLNEDFYDYYSKNLSDNDFEKKFEEFIKLLKTEKIL